MLVTLHVIAIASTLALVLYADEEAFQYVRGKRTHLDVRVVTFLHYAVATGLGVVMVTGGLLYSRAPTYYLSNPIFIVKLVAVASLIINSAAIEYFSVHAMTQPFAALPARTQRALLVSGGLSVLGWGTALVCGLLLGGYKLTL